MIHAKIDDVFKILMEKLQLQIPKWETQRYIKAKILESKSGKETLSINDCDEAGRPYQFLKSAKIDGKITRSVALTEDRMQKNSTFETEFQFYGHFNEPKLNLIIPREILKQNDNEIRIKMTFDPCTKKCTQNHAYSKKYMTLTEIKFAQQLAGPRKAVK